MIARHPCGTGWQPVPLLPSGPGGVRGLPLRRTRLSAASSSQKLRTKNYETLHARNLFCAPYYNITAPIMQPQGTISLVPIVTRTHAMVSPLNAIVPLTLAHSAGERTASALGVREGLRKELGVRFRSAGKQSQTVNSCSICLSLCPVEPLKGSTHSNWSRLSPRERSPRSTAGEGSQPTTRYCAAFTLPILGSPFLVKGKGVRGLGSSLFVSS